MGTTPRRRLRSSNVVLGLTLVAAASFVSGCAEETPDYQAICVDPQTNQRLDDDQCDDSDRDYSGSGSGFFWFYVGSQYGGRVPGVGQTYSPSMGTYNGSSVTKGGRSVVRGGVPKTGASSMKSYTSSTVKSGGFGGSGKSSS